MGWELVGEPMQCWYVISLEGLKLELSDRLRGQVNGSLSRTDRRKQHGAYKEAYRERLSASDCSAERW